MSQEGETSVDSGGASDFNSNSMVAGKFRRGVCCDAKEAAADRDRPADSRESKNAAASDGAKECDPVVDSLVS